MKGNDVVFVGRRRGLEAAAGREVGKRALEAMNRQAVFGLTGGFFVPRGGRSHGFSVRAGAQHGSGLAVGIVLEQRRKLGAHAMLNMVCQHAKKNV